MYWACYCVLFHPPMRGRWEVGLYSWGTNNSSHWLLQGCVNFPILCHYVVQKQLGHLDILKMVMSTEPRNPLVLLYCKLSRGSWPDRGMEQPFEDSGEAGLTMAPLNTGWHPSWCGIHVKPRAITWWYVSNRQTAWVTERRTEVGWAT